MASHRSLLLAPSAFAFVPLLLLALYADPKKPLFVANSPDNPALINAIRALSPTVSLDDARRVTACAVNTGLELRREWHVGGLSTLLPGLQNLFVKTGATRGGYCFQYCSEMLVRLDALKLQTVEFHWAESQPGTMSENNGIVVTARGQPFREGVLLDNWRAQGHLAWTHVTTDPEYRWKENKAFAAHVLESANATAEKTAGSDVGGTAREKPSGQRNTVDPENLSGAQPRK